MITLANHPKYLINVGIYSAIYIVIFIATAALGFAAPPLLFVGWIVGTIMNGVVLTLYRLRTPVFGAMTVLACLEGLIAISRGYPAYTLVGAVVLGFIADAIAHAGGYTSRWHLAVGYAVFAPWIAFPLVPVLINSEAYFAKLAEKASNAAYVEQMQQILTPSFIGIWVILLVITGLIGGWLGNKLTDKHFKKAGLVS